MSITVIMKPTEACNAACVYCSAWKDDVKHAMTIPEVLHAIDKIMEYAIHKNYPNLILTWHGGEPFLPGVDFYRAIYNHELEWIKKTGIEIRNHFQSNLLELEEPMIPLLKDMLSLNNTGTLSIGSSLDIVDGVRLFRNLNYREEWEKNARRLEQEGIRVGVLFVIHRENIEKVDEFFQYMEEHPERSFRFNPLYYEGKIRVNNRELLIEPEQWGHFLAEIHTGWKNRGKNLYIAPVMMWEQFHQDGFQMLSCDYQLNCAGSHLGVSPGGEVHNCGRGADRAKDEFGNIFQSELMELMKSEKLIKLSNRAPMLMESECSGCKWWRYCHGGCPMESDMYYGDIFHPTYWCEGLKVYFEKVFQEPSKHHIIQKTPVTPGGIYEGVLP